MKTPFDSRKLSGLTLEGFEIIETTELGSAQLAVDLAKATGAREVTHQDGQYHATVRRIEQ